MKVNMLIHNNTFGGTDGFPGGENVASIKAGDIFEVNFEDGRYIKAEVTYKKDPRDDKYAPGIRQYCLDNHSVSLLEAKVIETDFIQEKSGEKCEFIKLMWSCGEIVGITLQSSHFSDLTKSRKYVNDEIARPWGTPKDGLPAVTRSI